MGGVSPWPVKGKSSSADLIVFWGDVTNGENEAKAVGVVYLAFSTAFGAACCNILKTKKRRAGASWAAIGKVSPLG